MRRHTTALWSMAWFRLLTSRDRLGGGCRLSTRKSLSDGVIVWPHTLQHLHVKSTAVLSGADSLPAKSGTEVPWMNLTLEQNNFSLFVHSGRHPSKDSLGALGPQQLRAPRLNPVGLMQASPRYRVVNRLHIVTDSRHSRRSLCAVPF